MAKYGLDYSISHGPSGLLNLKLRKPDMLHALGRVSKAQTRKWI